MFEPAKFLCKKEVEDPADFVLENLSEINQKFNTKGAVLFRGFKIENPLHFEKILKIFESDLKNDYLGTSPRNRLSEFVFSASELPPHYPIMQHCEMSFLPSAPRRLFFYCDTAPEKGGETPVCDFAAVARNMNPEIKEEFKKRGIRNIRNYAGPNSGNKKSVKQLKPWPEMFLTKDKTEVEKICQDNGLEFEWTKNDGLRLINDQAAFKIHPKRGEEIWFNHLQVFHSAAAKIEYSKIANRQKNPMTYMISAFLKWNYFWENLTVPAMNRAMHCTFADGGKIPESYVQHVQDLIWRNMYFLHWEKGDFIFLDNFAVSHGRMPYEGPRVVLVAWSS